MSNFKCEKCGAEIIDSEVGYVSGCEHYPPEYVEFEVDFRNKVKASLKPDGLYDVYLGRYCIKLNVSYKNLMTLKSILEKTK